MTTIEQRGLSGLERGINDSNFLKKATEYTFLEIISALFKGEIGELIENKPHARKMAAEFAFKFVAAFDSKAGANSNFHLDPPVDRDVFVERDQNVSAGTFSYSIGETEGGSITLTFGEEIESVVNRLRQDLKDNPNLYLEYLDASLHVQYRELYPPTKATEEPIAVTQVALDSNSRNYPEAEVGVKARQDADRRNDEGKIIANTSDLLTDPTRIPNMLAVSNDESLSSNHKNVDPINENDVSNLIGDEKQSYTQPAEKPDEVELKIEDPSDPEADEIEHDDYLKPFPNLSDENLKKHTESNKGFVKLRDEIISHLKEEMEEKAEKQGPMKPVEQVNISHNIADRFQFHLAQRREMASRMKANGWG